MIEIKGLRKNFGDAAVLRDISISIDRGKIYGLIGRSGSGKSTLLRCVNGLIPYDGGSLTVDGVEVSSLAGRSLLELRRNIGMVFQNFSLLNRLDVFENIALPMRCWRYAASDIERRVVELLDMVHISEKRRSYPRELSGGQKQRVAIARALAMEPKILLCDEATSALDPSIAETIMDLLVEINRILGITIVIVTHQFEIVKRYCEKVFILEDGAVAAGGKCSEIFSSPPKTLRAIMGDIDRIALPREGRNIRIRVDAAGSSSKLLSEMSIATGKVVSVISAELERYAQSEIFSIRANVAETDWPIVESYLEGRGIAWDIMEDE